MNINNIRYFYSVLLDTFIATNTFLFTVLYYFISYLPFFSRFLSRLVKKENDV